MNAFSIKDLSLTAELDAEALAAVQGGCGYYVPTCYFPSLPSYQAPKAGNVDFNASQMMGQTQNTTVNNGNNVAFSHGISANVNPSQNGANTINFAR